LKRRVYVFSGSDVVQWPDEKLVAFGGAAELDGEDTGHIRMGKPTNQL
jgi:hypothetical protein